MKIFTTKGRKVIRKPSQFDRYVTIQIELGLTKYDAIKEWKLLTAIIKIKSENYATT